jgi:hypothetical protein
MFLGGERLGPDAFLSVAGSSTHTLLTRLDFILVLGPVVWKAIEQRQKRDDDGRARVVAAEGQWHRLAGGLQADTRWMRRRCERLKCKGHSLPCPFPAPESVDGGHATMTMIQEGAGRNWVRLGFIAGLDDAIQQRIQRLIGSE